MSMRVKYRKTNMRKSECVYERGGERERERETVFILAV